MKSLFRLFLLFIITSTSFSWSVTPHLLLNFDINETIIATDQATNKSIENTLNELLSKKISACWDASLTQPISYYDYVHKLQFPENSGEAKAKRRQATRHFLDFLSHHDHLLYGEALKTYTVAYNTLASVESSIFPSFYHLLDELDRKGISYSIFLRTFGEDLSLVKDEINSYRSGMFRDSGEFSRGCFVFENGKSIKNSYEIYSHFLAKKHIAIKDDYYTWAEHDLESKYGKVFYVDQNDKSILAIFFDDNINLNDGVDNIIAAIDPTNGESISIEMLADKGQVVQVDALEAIIDINYYIKRVEAALQHL